MTTNHLCQIIRSLINNISNKQSPTIIEIFLTLEKATKQLNEQNNEIIARFVLIRKIFLSSVWFIEVL